jgi:hypothetical protein
MLKVKGNIAAVIDVKKTLDDFHKDMTSFLFKTLKIWVTESTNPVPVWSGASRASFLKLAQQAQTSIVINPVATSRIPLGIETSEGEVVADPQKEYSWLWSSELAHIGIVEDRVGFVGAGLAAIRNETPPTTELQYVKSN